MATEDDKTNTGIAGTAIAVGVAAMIAGSSALVGMARTEVADVSSGTQAYADLNSMKALKSEQSQQLSSAKVSIDAARQRTLNDLKRNPDEASPWTPKPPPPEASSAASTETAPATDTSASATAASDVPAASASATEAATSAPEAASSAAPTTAAPAAPTTAATH